MNQLIAVKQADIGGQSVQSVDARELHSFLEVGKDFSTWMKDRVEQYGFVDGTDFEVFTSFGENYQVGRPAKEYSITLGMAKELSMVERNTKGKQARQYFIECERRLHTEKPSPQINTADVSDLERIVFAKSSGVISAEEARDAALLALGVALQKTAVAESVPFAVDHHDNYTGELVSAQYLEQAANVAAGSVSDMMLKHGLAVRISRKHGSKPSGRLMLTRAGRRIATQNGTKFIRFKLEPAIKWIQSLVPQLRY